MCTDRDDAHVAKGTFRNAAIAGYVVGALAGAAAVILYVEPSLFGADKPSAPRAAMPYVGPDGGGFVVVGAF